MNVATRLIRTSSLRFTSLNERIQRSELHFLAVHNVSVTTGSRNAMYDVTVPLEVVEIKERLRTQTLTALSITHRYHV
jgi:hypothetical protein